jgi:hypothetical protein
VGIGVLLLVVLSVAVLLYRVLRQGQAESEGPPGRQRHAA